MRWIMITDQSNKLLTQTFLKNKKDIEFNFNIMKISFTVTLKPKSKDMIVP